MTTPLDALSQVCEKSLARKSPGGAWLSQITPHLPRANEKSRVRRWERRGHSSDGDAPVLIQETGEDREKRSAHPRVVLAATAVMSLGVVAPVPLARALLVLPVALLAPGYALLMALFGDARRTGLDLVPLLALSILLSLACYPLLALLLHLAALPIATGTVVGATDAAIMLLLAGSSWRSPRHRPGMAPLDVATGGAWEELRGGLRFALVVVAAGLILAVTLRLLPTPASVPYTMFYLTGRSAYLTGPVGARGHRSVGLGPGERCAARARAAHLAARAAATGAIGTVDLSIGVTNGSAWRRSYRVAPLLDGVPCWPNQTLSLGPDASWSGHVGGAVPADGALHRLTITLRQPNGNGQDRAGSVGPLVVWVRGAHPLHVTHRSARRPSRPRQGSHRRRQGSRLVRHRIERAGGSPAWYGLLTGSAGGSPAWYGLLTGSAGGSPAWYGLHDGRGRHVVRLRRKREGRPRSQLSVRTTSRSAAVALHWRRTGHPRSQSDHVSTIMHRPRLPRRPLPRR